MKKLLALLVVVAFVLSAGLAVADNGDMNDNNPAYQHDVLLNGEISENPITTSVTVAGGSDGSTNNNNPPIVKVKWEYDLNVTNCLDGCDDIDCNEHDADPYTDGLQVKPVLGGDVTVGYYAVVTDPEGVDTVQKVYADVWHPDGQFKYQIELHPVGFDGSSYDKTEALNIWDHVTTNHSTLLTYNTGYDADDVYHQLDQQLSYLYRTEADLSYHQPGGYYTVGVSAVDNFNEFSTRLDNNFWYIPTSAVDIDFDTVNYGNAVVGTRKTVGGDYEMTTPDKPTVRNVGNTPVKLYVSQNDMGFGYTSSLPNVRYGARIGADEAYSDYAPDTLTEIPGNLSLCTQDKLDFAITVLKSVPSGTYTGEMNIYAYIEGSPIWNSNPDYVTTAPIGVDQVYSP